MTSAEKEGIMPGAPEQIAGRTCDIDGSDEMHDGSERYWHCEAAAVVVIDGLAMCAEHRDDL